MKPESPLGFYLRILIVSVLVAFFGITPAPSGASEFSARAFQSVNSGELLAGAANLAGLAQYYPWRYDLNITAARYAFQNGQPRLAIQYLERPGTVSHLSTDDLLLLGDAYNQSGNSTMAQAIWKHIGELENSIAPYERLANSFLQQKNYVSAAGYFQKQLILDPSRVGLYMQIGGLYAVTDPTKALSFLAQAVEMSPADAAQAKALHDKIITASLFDEPAYTSLTVGRQFGVAGQWELAAAAFRQAIKLKPSYADAWAFCGEAKQQLALIETGHVSDVGLSELQQAAQLDGSSTLVNTLLALYWERQEDYSKAEQYINHAINSSPQDPFLYSELGNIYSKAGDLPAAQSAYINAIRITPRDPLFYRQLAQFAMDNNIQTRELALPAARQALQLNSKDPVSLDLMAQVMLVLVDYSSAERFAQDAIKSDPGYAPAYLHLGIAYLYQGETEQAKLWLTQAETIEPNSWVNAQATRLLEYYFP